MTRRALTTCLLAGITLLAAWTPAAATAQAPPSVSAPSALVVEASTGDELFAKAADKRRAIASTTKLMTALLVLERAKPSTIVPAARYRALPVESKLGLRAGERLTVADLLRGMLVASANDAAATLADGVGGSRAAFVRAMNLRARQLGLKGTHYTNPIGLDAPGNYSTARDLARLTLKLRGFAFFRRTVARATVTLRSGDHPRKIDNVNKLVSLPEINGVKTGHTGGAGWVLIGSGQKRGITLVSVVLGDASEAARQADTRRLLEWGFGRYKRVRAAEPGEVLARVPIRYRRGAELALVTQSSGRRIVVRSDERLRRCGVQRPAQVSGPIKRGQRLGKVEICRGSTSVADVALVAAAAVPAAGMGQQTKDWFTRPFSLLVVVLAGLAGTVLLTRLRGRGPKRRRRARREPEAA